MLDMNASSSLLLADDYSDGAYNLIKDRILINNLSLEASII